MGEMADLISEQGFDSEMMDEIHRQQASDSEYWEYFGDVNVHTEGKYLFFAERREVLKEIVYAELTGGFKVGKISKKSKNGSFVLCLYHDNDSQKNRLAKRYGSRADVAYRYWKSNIDTLRGKYSVEYLESKNNIY